MCVRFAGCRARCCLWLSNDPEDVRRLAFGPQRHVISATAPSVTDSGEKIFNEELLIGSQTEPIKIEIDPTPLFLQRIEVDRDQNRVLEPGSGLGVAKQIEILRGVEVQR